MANTNSISSKSARPTTKTAKTTPRTNAPVNSLDALETPVIAPEFCGTLAEQVQQTLCKWLKENAPADVYILFNWVDSLSSFEKEAERHNGLVRNDVNQDIAKNVTACINAIAALGGTFSGPYSVSVPRKVKVGAK